MKTRFGTKLATAIVASLLMATVLVVPAGATSVDSEPQPNGCSFVRDRGFTFDFKDVCDNHDLCYFTHGEGQLTRKQCDVQFKNEMYEWCDDNKSGFAYRSCRSVAWVYYIGVRIFGGFSWSQYSDPALENPAM